MPSPLSYSVEVPSNAIVAVYPPEAATTTTVPASPTLVASGQNTRAVGFAVPAGGGGVFLGSATRVGWPVAADSKEAFDDVGKDTTVYAQASAGTVVVEVLVVQ